MVCYSWSIASYFSESRLVRRCRQCCTCNNWTKSKPGANFSECLTVPTIKKDRSNGKPSKGTGDLDVGVWRGKSDSTQKVRGTPQTRDPAQESSVLQRERENKHHTTTTTLFHLEREEFMIVLKLFKPRGSCITNGNLQSTWDLSWQESGSRTTNKQTNQ